MTRTIQVINAGYAIVDDADYEATTTRTWRAAKRRGLIYVASYSPGSVFLHRFILGSIPKGMVVDHIDGDGLNNRRTNLRICRQSENSKNRTGVATNPSGFKGVSWKASGCNKWRARIMVERKEIILGVFLNKDDAARAYDEAAMAYFGEFARLNFPAAA